MQNFLELIMHVLVLTPRI